MGLLRRLPGPEAGAGVSARRRQAVGGLAGLVAALAYSSFLLGGPLGSTLDPMNSYVSELGAPTQPASRFFRGTDVVAGGLMVVLAVALRDSLPRGWCRGVGTTALGLAGASSVFDGCYPIESPPSRAWRRWATCWRPYQGTGAWAAAARPPPWSRRGCHWPSCRSPPRTPGWVSSNASSSCAPPRGSPRWRCCSFTKWSAFRRLGGAREHRADAAPAARGSAPRAIRTRPGWLRTRRGSCGRRSARSR